MLLWQVLAYQAEPESAYIAWPRGGGFIWPETGFARRTRATNRAFGSAKGIGAEKHLALRRGQLEAVA